MSTLAQDSLDAAVRKVGRMARPDWKKYALGGDRWGKVSEAMIKALDNMKDNGASKPLAKLQELAFMAALKPDAPREAHTAAFWLTDTRARLERLKDDPWPGDRRILEQRGILKGGG